MKTYNFVGTVFGAYNQASMWHKTQEGHYYVSIDLGPFSSHHKAVVDDYGTLVPVFRYMF